MVEIDKVPVIPKRPDEASQPRAAAGAPVMRQCLGNRRQRGSQLLVSDRIATFFHRPHVPRELVHCLSLVAVGVFVGLHDRLCADERVPQTRESVLRASRLPTAAQSPRRSRIRKALREPAFTPRRRQWI